MPPSQKIGNSKVTDDDADEFRGDVLDLYWRVANTLDSLPLEHPAREAWLALDRQLAPCRSLASKAVNALFNDD